MEKIDNTEHDMDTVTETIFGATKTVIDICKGDAGFMRPSGGIELVRCANAALNKVEEIDGVQEMILEDDFQLKASVFGQVLMVHLPTPDQMMTLDDKQFYMAVAAHMGPDWLDQLRRVAAFMIKVEGFN
jgi:hypothetical protein